jgi:hypothetical protein
MYMWKIQISILTIRCLRHLIFSSLCVIGNNLKMACFKLKCLAVFYLLLSLIQTCTPNGDLYRVTCSRCRIDTINSPDDGHMAA